MATEKRDFAWFTTHRMSQDADNNNNKSGCDDNTVSLTLKPRWNAELKSEVRKPFLV